MKTIIAVILVLAAGLAFVAPSATASEPPRDGVGAEPLACTPTGFCRASNFACCSGCYCPSESCPGTLGICCGCP